MAVSENIVSAQALHGNAYNRWKSAHASTFTSASCQQVMTLDCFTDNKERAVGTARLAQSAERKALDLVVVGSSPTAGAFPRPRAHSRNAARTAAHAHT